MRAKHVFLLLAVMLSVAACESNPRSTASADNLSVRSAARSELTLVMRPATARPTRSDRFALKESHFRADTEAQWLLITGARGATPTTNDQWWSTRDLRSSTRAIPAQSPHTLAPPAPASTPNTQPFAVSVEPRLPARLTVYFESDSATVSSDERQRVRYWLEGAASSDDFDVELHGHADARGSDAHNIALSTRRANALKRELIALRVPPTRIQVFGHGEAEPAATNATEPGRAANRRVSIITSQGTTRER